MEVEVLELVVLLVVCYITLITSRSGHRGHIMSAKVGTVALTTISGVVTSPDVEFGIVEHENAHHRLNHLWVLFAVDVYVTTLLVVYAIELNWYGVVMSYLLGCVAAVLLRAMQEVQADKAALNTVSGYPEQLEHFMRKVGAWKQPTWKHVCQGYMPPAYRIQWLKKLRMEAS